MSLRIALLDEPDAAAAIAPAWDALAVAAARPYAAPAWTLAWWRHMAPPGARLRIAAAFDGERLAGVAPCWGRAASGGERLALLASDVTHGVEPVCDPGRERELGHALAAALATVRPAWLTLAGVPAGSPWPAALAHRRARLPARRWREQTMVAPLADVAAGADAWWSSRSRNLRAQVRRGRREVQRAGGTIRLSEGDALDADLGAFVRLHLQRWEPRGGSAAVRQGTEAMLGDVARELAAERRLRAWVVELPDGVAAVQILVAAGGRASYWLGGFDERWASLRPGLLALVAAIEDAAGRGDAVVDLGGGDQGYKRRLATGDATLEWFRIVPVGRGLPAAGASVLARRTRLALSEHVVGPLRARAHAARTMSR